MPCRLSGILLLLLAAVSVVRAQGDAVLFTVGAEAVSRKEFEYHFGKSCEKRADVFAETYGRFKQKVQYAKELALDTLPTYRLQKECFRQMWLAKGRQSRNASIAGQGSKEWVKLLHVTYPLKQSAGKEEQMWGKRYLDSLYVAFSGKPDAGLEELPWMQTRHLLKEWQEQLKVLGKGECSRPFFSPLGIHIIVWVDKSVERSIVKETPMDDEAFRVQELEEALLVVALDEYLQKKLSCTAKELEDYFKEHKTRYGGGVPHFRGAVIHCQNKKEAKAIKKYLQKYPEAVWQEAAERMPDGISKGFRLEAGLYAIGVNPYVDKLVFKCGNFEPLADYPYTWVMGKKLKKGPTDYRDVRAKVEKDCLEGKKQDEMEAFMRKYKVEIDKEVLKTVNRAGNK